MAGRSSFCSVAASRGSIAYTDAAPVEKEATKLDHQNQTSQTPTGLPGGPLVSTLDE